MSEGRCAGALAQPIGIDVLRFAELVNDEQWKLALPDYQRPYVWSRDRVSRLVLDLREHLAGARDARDYYMGSVVLHASEADGKRYIVDGQQRLVTLCLLRHVVEGEFPRGQALELRSDESVRNVHEAAGALRALGVLAGREPLLASVVFTVITVHDEDLAFTFFDTQNTRSVPLAATDLLKAYHLRAITVSNDRTLQRACARTWEQIQGLDRGGKAARDHAARTFESILWPARTWTGTRARYEPSTRDSMVAEFAERSKAPPASCRVALYPGRLNRAATAVSVTVTADDGLAPIHWEPGESGGLPAEARFAIRQPVSSGVGYFLYAKRYAHLALEILQGGSDDRELAAFRRLDAAHEQAGLSRYLREMFHLAAVMYVDRFGTTGLFRFALWLDHVLGALRLANAAVRRETPLTSLLRDPARNLLDVLASAFEPDEVVEHLRALDAAWASKAYATTTDGNDGVKGRYAAAMRAYFGREESLADKATWIDALAKDELRGEALP